MSVDADLASPTDPSAAARRLPVRHGLLVLLAVALVFGLRARWFSGASQAAAVVNISSVTTHAEKPVLTDLKPEQADSAPVPTNSAQPTIFGSWRDNYYGERTMTFRPDGTGVMVIKLDSVGQALIGANLLFHLRWENRAGVLVMQFTGGEPQAAVKRISEAWGDRHEQQIELLSETDLHLRSTDSQNLYQLKRVDE